MTDPDWADRTYLEPLDAARAYGRCSSASGPTRCCRRWAVRRRWTLRSLLSERRAPWRSSGSSSSARRTRRSAAPRTASRSARRWPLVGLRVLRTAVAHSPQEARVALGGEFAGTAGRDPAGVPTRRPRRRFRAPTTDAFEAIVPRGLSELAPSPEVLIEESVAGWGEFELEVIRDRNDNVVIVCSIENLDPMGVQPGGLGLRGAGDDPVAASTRRCATRAATVIRAVASRPAARTAVRGEPRDRRARS